VGGHSRLYLRLVPFPGSESFPREMLIRQQSVYRFTPQDVELTVEMQLDILNEPLNQLAMTVDPALRVVQVTHAGRPALDRARVGPAPRAVAGDARAADRSGPSDPPAGAGAHRVGSDVASCR
jgi:hypothetical protein